MAKWKTHQYEHKKKLKELFTTSPWIYHLDNFAVLCNYCHQKKKERQMIKCQTGIRKCICYNCFIHNYDELVKKYQNIITSNNESINDNPENDKYLNIVIDSDDD